MTKNEEISKPLKVIERQTLEVENVVEKNKYFTILLFSQLYTQLDTCQKFHQHRQMRKYYAGINTLISRRLYACSYDVKCYLFGVVYIEHVLWAILVQ